MFTSYYIDFEIMSNLFWVNRQAFLGYWFQSNNDPKTSMGLSRIQEQTSLSYCYNAT